MDIQIPISPGELADKITILEIKAKLIKDKEKRKSINSELKLLNKEFDKIKKSFPKISGKINARKKKLYDINKKLWNIEDKLRLMESKKEFNDKFIKAARMVYKYNDSRSGIKNEINGLLGSKISEVKSYAKY